MVNIKFSSFGDELIKIALFQKLRNNIVGAMKEGWNGTPAQIAAGEGSTWFGAGRVIKPGMGPMARRFEEASSLGGLTKALPVGNKSMMALGTGLMARDALKPVDPTGRQRSRTERLIGVAGNTVGGLLGAAYGNRLRPGLAGTLVGGMVGAGLGEKAVTAPFALARHNQQQVPQYPPQQGVAI